MRMLSKEMKTPALVFPLYGGRVLSLPSPSILTIVFTALTSVRQSGPLEGHSLPFLVFLSSGNLKPNKLFRASNFSGKINIKNIELGQKQQKKSNSHFLFKKS